jgi:hypothetical protein
LRTTVQENDMTTQKPGRRAAIALALTAMTIANPVCAQSTGRATATPLADSARAVVAARSQEFTAVVSADQPAPPPRTGKSCGARVATRLAVRGGGAGLATGYVILARAVAAIRTAPS